MLFESPSYFFTFSLRALICPASLDRRRFRFQVLRREEVWKGRGQFALKSIRERDRLTPSEKWAFHGRELVHDFRSSGRLFKHQSEIVQRSVGPAGRCGSSLHTSRSASSTLHSRRLWTTITKMEVKWDEGEGPSTFFVNWASSSSFQFLLRSLRPLPSLSTGGGPALCFLPDDSLQMF